MQTTYIDELKKNPKAVLDDVSVEICSLNVKIKLRNNTKLEFGIKK